MFGIGRRKRIMQLTNDPINREIRRLKEENRLIEKEIRLMHLEVN
jgi:hypothetical protein